MKVSTILDHIDSGHVALPEFQRGYVWNRDQVRSLMDSLYHEHPVGSLLVWVTNADGVIHRGDADLAAGAVKLLLDGQQRITSLYGIIRGKPPAFFQGNESAFRGLYFNVGDEEFRFYQPSRMANDPLWINVTTLMQEGLDAYFQSLRCKPNYGTLMARLNKISNIREREFHVDEVTGPDKTVNVVVDIFNRVNSQGTTLSNGDLALAKICASWPECRNRMNSLIDRWRNAGYWFTRDWLLRTVNAIVTGEARFEHLHNTPTERIKEGLEDSKRYIDEALNLISGRLGIDHNRVLFGRYALPIVARYLHKRGGRLTDAGERDRVLYWYFQSAMWGRFSGSTETFLNKDLEVLEDVEGGIDGLIDQLRLWHGHLRIEAAHFGGWSLGARFYPVLYALTRTRDAKDFGTGLSLNSHLLGRMNTLEVHHIFSKAVLYKHGYSRTEVNAVANYCFLTKATNLHIGAAPPVEYFPQVEANQPGVLASQWIPLDPELWKVENYPSFLEKRRRLLADAANTLLKDLLHEKPSATGSEKDVASPLIPSVPPTTVSGSIESEQEQVALTNLNNWVCTHGLPPGQLEYELAHPDSGDPQAILDIAWPNGLQQGYSQPVAVLLDEEKWTLQIANDHGFRHFTSIDAFQKYVKSAIFGNYELD